LIDLDQKASCREGNEFHHKVHYLLAWANFFKGILISWAVKKKDLNSTPNDMDIGIAYFDDYKGFPPLPYLDINWVFKQLIFI